MSEKDERHITQVDLNEIKNLKSKLKLSELQYKIAEQEYTIFVLKTFIKNRMDETDCFDEETGLIKKLEQ